uniref:GLI1 n=1 Tax=Echinostoma caproni TaxID=27848 RepID=A0A183ANN3_9TREM
LANTNTVSRTQANPSVYGHHQPQLLTDQELCTVYGKQIPGMATMNDSFPLGSSQRHCSTDEVNLPVKPVSSEAAHLMSQLSTQLQQLATRTNDITLSSSGIGGDHPTVSSSGDGFDLPPPPPDSMFTGTNDPNLANQSHTPSGQDALLTALKRSIEMRAAKANARDHSGPSRPD